MFKFIGKFYIKKARKAQLNEFAKLLEEIPKVNRIEDCYKGYASIAKYVKGLENNDPLKPMCGKLIEYLTDTKEHINKGYHKPSWNGWKTKREYPNINDYIDIGVKLNQF